jgi:glutamate racemase
MAAMPIRLNRTEPKTLRRGRPMALPRVASPSLVPDDIASAPATDSAPPAPALKLPLFQLPTIQAPSLIGPPVSPRDLEQPVILVFDSGLGGLTVWREIGRARPDARFVYLADDEAFPYGRLSEGDLITRVTGVIGQAITRHQPDLVVIACNTASTIVLGALRQRFRLPFVGTVPAIKPACAASQTRRITVLGTPGTVAREYTRALIREYAGDCHVDLVGSAHLAGLAESYMRGTPLDDAALAAEIAPCFHNDARGRTDTIVLACTHYPLLTAQFERLSPWPVRFLDPAPAIARRVTDLVGPVHDGAAMLAPLVLTFTSGRQMALADLAIRFMD